MPDRIALIRADASATIGTGHVRRCLALAHALARARWTCRFAVGEESLVVVPELLETRFEVRTLPPGASRNARALAATAGECDLLIVDHYGLDRAFETDCRRFARRILVIDDLPGRNHDADALVDPTPGRSAEARLGHAPAGASLLVGPAFAPLRSELSAARFRPREKKVGERRLVVSFGGTDPDDATGRFLEALTDTPLPGWRVDLILGRGARHAARVREIASRAGKHIQFHLDPPHMVELLAGADLALGAGGVSALERCCLGLPSVLLVIADNQRGAADALAAAGAVAPAADTREAMAAVRALASDEARRARMAAAAMALCDGRGAQRIMLRLDPPRARDDRPVFLQPATMGDSDMLLHWQRQPETRRYARVPMPPDEATHRAWFAARLASPDCLPNIVFHDTEPAGMLRLDRKGEKGWEVSILIDAARHGRGIGAAALAAARRLVPEASLLAEVLPENTASHALFARAGYRRMNGWYEAKP
jgi:UDP-2,4-diacetamido-2,4,6-trideoxy-beta-L-altropyranose hydrolase